MLIRMKFVVYSGVLEKQPFVSQQEVKALFDRTRPQRKAD